MTAPQVKQTLPSYEGQTVTILELTGQPGLKTAPLLAALPQKQGQPFSQVNIDASMRYLRAHGVIGPQLEVTPEMNGLRVAFVLHPAYYFGVYEFPGAARFQYTRLLEASKYLTQEPYSEVDIAQAQKGLVQYFQREGYFLAKVTPHSQVNRKHHLVNVNFVTALGPHAKYGSLILNGVTPAQATRLKSDLHSIMARLRGASVLPGHGYSLNALRSATNRLQGLLDDEGYLAAQVRLGAARYDPRTNRADIIYNIRTGPPVHLTVSGVHLWPWTRHSLIPIYAVKQVNPELVQEGQDDLTSHMAAQGYFDARVTTTVSVNGHQRVTSQVASGPLVPAAAAAMPAQRATPPPLPPSMNLQTQVAPSSPRAKGGVPPSHFSAPARIHYQVSKGARHIVKKVTFTGNTAFSDSQLQSQVKIQPKSWWFFSHGKFSNQLLESSISNLTDYYKADGYNHVKVSAHVSRPGGNVQVNFHIDQGKQDHVATVTLQGNTLSLSKLAPQGLKLAPGKPYTQVRLQQDRNTLLARYLSLGYLNANVRVRATQLPKQPNQIAVVYQINEGPQVRVDTVITDGRDRTKQRYINLRTEDLHSEDYLSEKSMMAAETKLYEPGIFDWADVSTQRPVTTQPLEDVVVRVHEGPRNQLTYGFGFDLTNRGGSVPSGTIALPGLPPVGLPSSFKTSQSTFWGPTGNVQYSRLNLFGKAETLSAGAYAGRLDQRANVTFTDPNFRWSIWSANLLVSGEVNEENPIFSSQVGDFAFQLQRPLNAARDQNIFLRYDFNQTYLSRLLIPELITPENQHVRLSTLSATYIRDTRDNPLDAHRGMFETAEFDYNPSFLGSSANFGKFLGQVAAYRKIFGNTIWANSLRLGLEQPFGGSFVPLSQAFFTGGGSTLRGFPLDGAGPQRTIPACGNPSDPSTCGFLNLPMGGNEMVITNSEFRIPTPWIMQNLGVALFYDGGNVFQRIGFSHLGANWSNTVGFGLRYSTPVGPVRVDIGHNLNPPPGIKSTQIFLTLGQAF